MCFLLSLVPDPCLNQGCLAGSPLSPHYPTFALQLMPSIVHMHQCTVRGTLGDRRQCISKHSINICTCKTKTVTSIRTFYLNNKLVWCFLQMQRWRRVMSHFMLHPILFCVLYTRIKHVQTKCSYVFKAKSLALNHKIKR